MERKDKFEERWTDFTKSWPGLFTDHDKKLADAFYAWGKVDGMEQVKEITQEVFRR